MTARQLQPCGTPAAYRRHLRHGEKACDPCKAAINQDIKDRLNNRKVGPCGTCRRDRQLRSCGWCDSCNGRWLRAGKPEGGPPPLNSDPRTPARIAGAARARAAQNQRVAARREDYALLREQGVGVEEAADRVGISATHARNSLYESALTREVAS